MIIFLVCNLGLCFLFGRCLMMERLIWSRMRLVPIAVFVGLLAVASVSEAGFRSRRCGGCQSCQSCNGGSTCETAGCNACMAAAPTGCNACASAVVPTNNGQTTRY